MCKWWICTADCLISCNQSLFSEVSAVHFFLHYEAYISAAPYVWLICIVWCILKYSPTLAILHFAYITIFCCINIAHLMHLNGNHVCVMLIVLLCVFIFASFFAILHFDDTVFWVYQSLCWLISICKYVADIFQSNYCNEVWWTLFQICSLNYEYTSMNKFFSFEIPTAPAIKRIKCLSPLLLKTPRADLPLHITSKGTYLLSPSLTFLVRSLHSEWGQWSFYCCWTGSIKIENLLIAGRSGASPVSAVRMGCMNVAPGEEAGFEDSIEGIVFVDMVEHNATPIRYIIQWKQRVYVRGAFEESGWITASVSYCYVR